MAFKNDPVRNIRKGLITAVVTGVLSIVVLKFGLNLDDQAKAAVVTGLVGLTIAVMDAVKHRKG